MSDVYVDSRGVEMQPVAFSDALDLVYDLACGNQLDEHEVKADSPLAAATPMGSAGLRCREANSFRAPIDDRCAATFDACPRLG